VHATNFNPNRTSSEILYMSKHLINKTILEWNSSALTMALVLTIIMLSGCGGAGKDEGGYQDDESPPVASAQVIGLGLPVSGTSDTYSTRANTEVQLTGKNSAGSAAPVLYFSWEQIDNSGYAVELIERTTNAVVFDAPNVAAETTLSFLLTITDANNNIDSATVHVNVEPVGDVDQFLVHPSINNKTFEVLAALQEGTNTGDVQQPFTLTLTTVVHWRNQVGELDQLEVSSAVINSAFPASFSTALGYDPLVEPRNPRLSFPIPTLDTDEINKNFEDSNRQRRIEPYETDSVYAELQVEISSNSGANFELIALDVDGVQIDLADLLFASKSDQRARSSNVASAQNLQNRSLIQTWNGESSTSISVTNLRDQLGLENAISSNNYYSLLDPTGAYESFQSWGMYAGFLDSNGAKISDSSIASALYLNNYDLGFGREMYVRTDSLGNVFSYVVNYPTLEQGIEKRGEFAIVAMEYSDNPDTSSSNEKIVKFYVFVPDERTGDFTRVNSINFDGRGEKYVPGVCGGCHQGYASGKKFTVAADADIGATFLPWDLDAFLYAKATDTSQVEPTLDIDSFSTALLDQYSRENQEASLKAFNLAVLATYKNDSIRNASAIEMIHGWYGDKEMAPPIDQLPDNTTFDGSYVPTSWGGQDVLYHQVFAKHCRMCHLQVADEENNFDSYSEFIGNTLLKNYVYEQGRMPLARLAMDRFWSGYNGTSTSADEDKPVDILRAHLEGLGQTIPTFPGLPVPTFTISNLTPTIDDIVTIDATGSLFAESYLWQFSDQPVTSSINVDNGTEVIGSFSPDVPGGVYNVQLTATNENGISESTTQSITVTNRSPIAECLAADTSGLQSSGLLESIPIVSALAMESLGDGQVQLSSVDDGTLGSLTIDVGNLTVSYQLFDPFERGIDTVYYQLDDGDGSLSSTSATCSSVPAIGFGSISIDSSPSGTLVPVNVSAVTDDVNNTSEISVSWSAPTGINPEGYKLFRDAVEIAALTTTEYTDTGLVDDTSYAYTVTSIIGSDSSNSSASASATTAVLSPNSLVGSAIDTQQIDLSWSAPVGNVTQYHVYRDNIEIATSIITSYSDTDLTAGTEYTYMITASDTVQESAPSDSTAVTVIPLPPSNVVGTRDAVNDSSEIDLVWDVPSSGIFDTYRIYRNGVAIATPTVTTFADTGLTPYTDYTYQISTIAGGEESTTATSNKVRTAAVGTTEPTGLLAAVNATNDATQIDLAWTGPTGYTADTFTVLRDGNEIASSIATNSYSDTSLVNNTSYTYTVKAVYNDEVSIASPPAITSTLSLTPSAPNATVVDTGRIDLSWSSPVANATSYEVFRNGGSIGTTTNTTLSDTGLTAGTQYSYTLRATQSSDQGDISPATLATSAPNAPTNIAASTTDSTNIALSWTAASGNVDSYAIYRGGSLVGSSNGTSFNDTGRTPGTLYSYLVRSVRNSQESADSNTDSTTTTPNAPTSVSASYDTGNKTSRIVVSWSAPSGGVSSYIVYRDDTEVGTPSTNSFTDTGLISGTQYSYAIRSVSGGEESSLTGAVDGSTVPSAPDGVAATADSTTQITVSWNAVSGDSPTYTIFQDNVAKLSTSNTSEPIDGLNNYTAYSFTVKATTNTLLSDVSDPASQTTKVSYANNVLPTCAGCHAAASHFEPGNASVKFPACMANDCDGVAGDGVMEYTETSPEYLMIDSWISEGESTAN